jgi:hypothetical protein
MIITGIPFIAFGIVSSRQLLADIQKDDPAARIIGRIIPRQDKKITWVFT